MAKNEISTAYNRGRIAPEFGTLPTEHMPKKIIAMVLQECMSGDDLATSFTITAGITGGENMTLTHMCLNPNCQAAQSVWQKLTETVVDLPTEVVAK